MVLKKFIIPLFFLSIISFINPIFLVGCGGGESTTDESVNNENLLLDEIIVTLNPNGITPLSAIALVMTNKSCKVEIEIIGEESIYRAFHENATTHQIPIHGLYPDKNNEVVFNFIDSDGNYAYKTVYIQTEPIPDYFPIIEILELSENKMEPGWSFCEFHLGDNGVYKTQPFIFDHHGIIRWYMKIDLLGGAAFPIKVTDNGNLIFAFGQVIYEYDMLGNEINRWKIPGYGQHHEVCIKPNGNLLVAVDNTSITTFCDHIVEVNRSSGDIINVWDLRQLLDIDRFDLVENETDWFHMNSIWYSESDDCLIVSGRNQGVVKITNKNQLVWILAPHKGWGKAGVDGNGLETSDYLLAALDENGDPYTEEIQLGNQDAENFSWVWGQHAPMILPNGNYFIFDNGPDRNFGNGGLFSRGVEYKIDDDNMTVQQVWQYGKERGAEYYSMVISDVDLLPDTQNRLITPGIIIGDVTYGMISEVTYPGKDVVFEAKLSFENMFSGGILGWGQMDIMYRSERVKIFN